MAAVKKIVRAVHTETFSDHNTNPITLARFIMEDSAQYRKAQVSLALILNSIATASKVIGNAVQQAGVQGLHALRGETNVQGEDQKKLDVLANDVMINSLIGSRKVSVLVTEEMEEALVVEGIPHARYAVVFDPLDGSSNIECNVSVGTIFGIYHQTEGDQATLDDVLVSGRNLVAAGYVLYSSSTVMVLSTGHGVHSFTQDPNTGEFVMTQENLRIPEEPKKIVSVNTGNMHKWDAPVRDFVNWCISQSSPYSHRYIGSMVADVHRTLLYGGIFMYPADSKNKQGKLRVLYECFPMAFLIEQAGGVATTGTGDVLDVVPTQLHERCPIFLGCQRDVSKLLEFMQK